MKCSQAAVVLFLISLADGGLMASLLYFLKARFQFNKNQFADLMMIMGIGATLAQIFLTPIVPAIGEVKLITMGLLSSCISALGMSASVLAAVVAADNVICAVYFMVLFALASKIPPEAAAPTTDDAMDMESDYEGNLPVLQTATALATSFLICKAATYLTKLYGIQGGTLPGVTAIVVILATLLPKQIGSLGSAGWSYCCTDFVAGKILQVLLLHLVSVDR
ncbi:hypothetical protein RIF29_30081 [Crotalaria pallida]|uniref:Uncharacterized protein n=1 Tax=Crotalaria pallida TaxID=3830 RepID=A0AAN9HWG1_CROPI